MMPIRTCLVTNKKAEQSAFLRFTISQEGFLRFDGKQKQLGRGAYVIPDKKALDKLPFLAKKIQHFLRSESLPKIDNEAIEEQKRKLKDL